MAQAGRRREDGAIGLLLKKEAPPGLQPWGARSGEPSEPSAERSVSDKQQQQPASSASSARVAEPSSSAPIFRKPAASPTPQPPPQSTASAGSRTRDSRGRAGLVLKGVRISQERTPDRLGYLQLWRLLDEKSRSGMDIPQLLALLSSLSGSVTASSGPEAWQLDGDRTLAAPPSAAGTGAATQSRGLAAAATRAGTARTQGDSSMARVLKPAALAAASRSSKRAAAPLPAADGAPHMQMDEVFRQLQQADGHIAAIVQGMIAQTLRRLYEQIDAAKRAKAAAEGIRLGPGEDGEEGSGPNDTAASLSSSGLLGDALLRPTYATARRLQRLLQEAADMAGCGSAAPARAPSAAAAAPSEEAPLAAAAPAAAAALVAAAGPMARRRSSTTYAGMAEARRSLQAEAPLAWKAAGSQQASAPEPTLCASPKVTWIDVPNIDLASMSPAIDLEETEDEEEVSGGSFPDLMLQVQKLRNQARLRDQVQSRDQAPAAPAAAAFKAAAGWRGNPIYEKQPAAGAAPAASWRSSRDAQVGAAAAAAAAAKEPVVAAAKGQPAGQSERAGGADSIVHWLQPAMAALDNATSQLARQSAEQAPAPAAAAPAARPARARPAAAQPQLPQRQPAPLAAKAAAGQAMAAPAPAPPMQPQQAGTYSLLTPRMQAFLQDGAPAAAKPGRPAWDFHLYRDASAALLAPPMLPARKPASLNRAGSSRSDAGGNATTVRPDRYADREFVQQLHAARLAAEATAASAAVTTTTFLAATARRHSDPGCLAPDAMVSATEPLPPQGAVRYPSPTEAAAAQYTFKPLSGYRRLPPAAPNQPLQLPGPAKRRALAQAARTGTRAAAGNTQRLGATGRTARDGHLTARGTRGLPLTASALQHLLTDSPSESAFSQPSPASMPIAPLAQQAGEDVLACGMRLLPLRHGLLGAGAPNHNRMYGAAAPPIGSVAPPGTPLPVRCEAPPLPEGEPSDESSFGAPRPRSRYALGTASSADSVELGSPAAFADTTNGATKRPRAASAPKSRFAADRQQASDAPPLAEQQPVRRSAGSHRAMPVRTSAVPPAASLDGAAADALVANYSAAAQQLHKPLKAQLARVLKRDVLNRLPDEAAVPKAAVLGKRRRASEAGHAARGSKLLLKAGALRTSAPAALQSPLPAALRALLPLDGSAEVTLPTAGHVDADACAGADGGAGAATGVDAGTESAGALLAVAEERVASGEAAEAGSPEGAPPVSPPGRQEGLEGGSTAEVQPHAAAASSLGAPLEDALPWCSPAASFTLLQRHPAAFPPSPATPVTVRAGVGASMLRAGAAEAGAGGAEDGASAMLEVLQALDADLAQGEAEHQASVKYHSRRQQLRTPGSALHGMNPGAGLGLGSPLPAGSPALAAAVAGGSFSPLDSRLLFAPVVAQPPGAAVEEWDRPKSHPLATPLPHMLSTPARTPLLGGGLQQGQALASPALAPVPVPSQQQQQSHASQASFSFGAFGSLRQDASQHRATPEAWFAYGGAPRGATAALLQAAATTAAIPLSPAAPALTFADMGAAASGIHHPASQASVAPPFAFGAAAAAAAAASPAGAASVGMPFLSMPAAVAAINAASLAAGAAAAGGDATAAPPVAAAPLAPPVVESPAASAGGSSARRAKPLLGSGAKRVPALTSSGGSSRRAGLLPAVLSFGDAYPSGSADTSPLASLSFSPGQKAGQMHVYHPAGEGADTRTAAQGKQPHGAAAAAEATPRLRGRRKAQLVGAAGGATPYGNVQALKERYVQLSQQAAEAACASFNASMQEELQQLRACMSEMSISGSTGWQYSSKSSGGGFAAEQAQGREGEPESEPSMAGAAAGASGVQFKTQRLAAPDDAAAAAAAGTPGVSITGSSAFGWLPTEAPAAVAVGAPASAQRSSPVAANGPAAAPTPSGDGSSGSSSAGGHPRLRIRTDRSTPPTVSSNDTSQSGSSQQQGTDAEANAAHWAAQGAAQGSQPGTPRHSTGLVDAAAALEAALPPHAATWLGSAATEAEAALAVPDTQPPMQQEAPTAAGAPLPPRPAPLALPAAVVAASTAMYALSPAVRALLQDSSDASDCSEAGSSHGSDADGEQGAAQPFVADNDAAMLGPGAASAAAASPLPAVSPSPAVSTAVSLLVTPPNAAMMALRHRFRLAAEGLPLGAATAADAAAPSLAGSSAAAPATAAGTSGVEVPGGEEEEQAAPLPGPACGLHSAVSDAAKEQQESAAAAAAAHHHGSASHAEAAVGDGGQGPTAAAVSAPVLLLSPRNNRFSPLGSTTPGVATMGTDGSRSLGSGGSAGRRSRVRALAHKIASKLRAGSKLAGGNPSAAAVAVAAAAAGSTDDGATRPLGEALEAAAAGDGAARKQHVASGGVAAGRGSQAAVGRRPGAAAAVTAASTAAVGASEGAANQQRAPAALQGSSTAPAPAAVPSGMPSALKRRLQAVPPAYKLLAVAAAQQGAGRRAAPVRPADGAPSGSESAMAAAPGNAVLAAAAASGNLVPLAPRPAAAGAGADSDSQPSSVGGSWASAEAASPDEASRHIAKSPQEGPSPGSRAWSQATSQASSGVSSYALPLELGGSDSDEWEDSILREVNDRSRPSGPDEATSGNSGPSGAAPHVIGLAAAAAAAGRAALNAASAAAGTESLTQLGPNSAAAPGLADGPAGEAGPAEGSAGEAGPLAHEAAVTDATTPHVATAAATADAPSAAYGDEWFLPEGLDLDMLLSLAEELVGPSSGAAATPGGASAAAGSSSMQAAEEFVDSTSPMRLLRYLMARMPPTPQLRGALAQAAAAGPSPRGAQPASEMPAPPADRSASPAAGHAAHVAIACGDSPMTPADRQAASKPDMAAAGPPLPEAVTPAALAGADKGEAAATTSITPKTPAPPPAPPPPPPPPPGTAGRTPGGPRAPPPPPPPGSKTGFKKVTPTKEQQLRLKQLHWDKLAKVGPDSVWGQLREHALHDGIDVKQLEALFSIMDNPQLLGMLRAQRQQVCLVDRARAQNVSILLAGTHGPVEQLVSAYRSLDAPSEEAGQEPLLSAGQVAALAKVLPTEEEAKALALYLAGRHPDHPGVCDVALLGEAERYFLALQPLGPRLRQRLACMAFAKSWRHSVAGVVALLQRLQAGVAALKGSDDFKLLLHHTLLVGNHLNTGTAREGAAGFKLDTLLRLGDVKASDRKTSLLQFVLQSSLAASPSLADLAEQLAPVRAAAGLQLGVVAGQVEELEAGLAALAAEVAAAQAAADQGEGKGEAAFPQRQAFLEHMGAVLAAAAPAVAELKATQASCLTGLRELSAYFEDGDSRDLLRVPGIVAAFLPVFEKALRAVRAEEARAQQQAAPAAAGSRGGAGGPATPGKGGRMPQQLVQQEGHGAGSSKLPVAREALGEGAAAATAGDTAGMRDQAN